MTSAAMHHHLAYNHFPPVSMAWAPACEAAIALVSIEEGEALVTIPEGISFRGRSDDKAPAWALVETFNLQGFLDYTGEDYEDTYFTEPDPDEVLGQLPLPIFA